jgi:hypothetical protein
LKEGLVTALGAQAAKVRLRIENTYESGSTIITEPTVIVTLPIPAQYTDARSEWEYEQIFPHTGTGRCEGDSWYDVEIVESDQPALIGMTFAFGY